MKVKNIDQRIIGIVDNAALVLLVFYYINSKTYDYLTYCLGALLLGGALYSYYSEDKGKLWIFEVGALALLIYWLFFVGFDNNLLYSVLVCTVVACILRFYYIFQKKKQEQERRNRKRKKRKK